MKSCMLVIAILIVACLFGCMPKAQVDCLVSARVDSAYVADQVSKNYDNPTTMPADVKRCVDTLNRVEYSLRPVQAWALNKKPDEIKRP